MLTEPRRRSTRGLRPLRRAQGRPNGFALMLDGVSDYGNAGADASFAVATAGAMSWEMWLYSADFSQTFKRFVSRAVGGAPNPGNWHIGLSSSTRKPLFGSFRSSTFTATVSTRTLSDGAWHHLAVTYDNGSVIFYIDGVAEAAQAHGIVLDETGTQEVLIGAEQAGGTPRDFFTGRIDQLRIWDRKLAAKEITRSKARAISSAADLIASWTMDSLFDGTRTIYNDRRDVSGSPHATDQIANATGPNKKIALNGFAPGVGDSSPFTREVPFKVANGT